MWRTALPVVCLYFAIRDFGPGEPAAGPGFLEERYARSGA